MQSSACCCRLSPCKVFNAVQGLISFGFLKKKKLETAPDFNPRSKAVDLRQTLQRCYLVNLHPQPPVSPAWPVSSSVSRLDSPWLAVGWGRPPFTGTSGHRGPRPPVIGLDSSVLVPCCSELFSTATRSSGNWCRGALEPPKRKQSQLTGFVVTLKTFAAPPGRLSLGPKVTRVFDCTLWCHGRNIEGDAHI